jgi:ABC-2 type transport system ATP-binding protein
MDHDPAILATGLTKSFGSSTVLDGIDLQVPRGSVFALLGPNGAGKTTIVRILSTLLRPDAGRASVAGFDVLRDRGEVRRRISLTGQSVAIDELQTGEENLRMMARLSGLNPRDSRRRATDLLAQFDLSDAGRRAVVKYSGGMRRRLDLAAGLVGRPSVIFLDEPTTGLDLPSRQAMWRILDEFVTTGVTVFLTTQYLEEADQLADHIAVMNGGSIVAQGSPATLTAQVADQRLDITLVDAVALDAAVGRLGDRVITVDRVQLTIGIGTDGSASHIRGVLDEIDPDGAAVASFVVHQATLDDVFLALTGHVPAPSGVTTTEQEPAHV